MPNDVLIGLSDAKFWRGRDGEETPISEMSARTCTRARV